ncbi:MAG: aspartate carbamoyltransferase [Spirochaetales bacterium]|jgi:aspartate carbamoyltransferase|nr:aspartate carbamoyltransferase [Spirochaetales bacterium]
MMSSERGFLGRSISVVNDLSADEQIYLYEKTRAIKEAIKSGANLDEFQVKDPGLGIYLMFLEDSTRTKESFRNAAKFHGAKVNDFNAQTSSITTKKESITDTVKMLFGYSDRSLFIIRSKLEGVCRWLEEALGDYAVKLDRPTPSFINAGDGKHEHPTQEFLDEFTFLEKTEWRRDHIHVALVGDLLHGRTIHSKADGLGIFDKVTVDLIAPDELAMPDFYLERMTANGFNIRTFPSIAKYLDQKDVADIWYFTRLQLERMGEQVLEKADFLRGAVTFSRDNLQSLPETTQFYHPLPRHREHPTVPAFLDSTPLNGWDEQSINGYFTRITEIGMLAGKIGEDFEGVHQERLEPGDDFVEEAEIHSDRKPEYKVGIKPVDEGIVIDHIGKGRTIENIWSQIDQIRRIMKLNYRSSHGVYHTNDPKDFKGIISLPDILSFDERQIKMLGAIAPGCTFNIVKDKKVIRKYRLHIPPRIYNFDEISCKNEGCISFPEHYQHVRKEFFRSDGFTFVCNYCEKPHQFEEIWDY